MLLTEGRWNTTVESAELAKKAFTSFQDLQTDAVESIMISMRNHPNLQSLFGIPLNALTVDSSALFCSSSSSSFLNSAHHPSTSLSFADQGLDDLMTILLSNDIQNNHTLTSINLDNNYIMQIGRLALIKAIQCNVTLKSIYYNNQVDPAPMSLIYDDTRKRNIKYNIELEQFMKEAKVISFNYRMKIAFFIRGTFLNISSLENILEFLIGPGSQVARFMRYR